MFLARVLVEPSKQLKQKIQMEPNIVKNPNWPEANQLAIYKRGRGFELGATENQIKVVRDSAGLEPGTARLAKLPPRATLTSLNRRSSCTLWRGLYQR